VHPEHEDERDSPRASGVHNGSTTKTDEVSATDSARSDMLSRASPSDGDLVLGVGVLD